ncbi:hypothetical protein KCP76_04075 [Salmonella enterica subsp. enterica serovar Weltevreden]|nr:hypothetical protein KCP76_04075 [Salmonella enterica subsp. enterica serovar Weltevreden]
MRLRADSPVAYHVDGRCVTAAGGAEAGLKQQALPYSRRDHKGRNVCYSGALDDVKYSGSPSIYVIYYRTWGGTLCAVAIELKMTGSRDAHFSTGAEGYIKMSPRPWYFPSRTQFNARK